MNLQKPPCRRKIYVGPLLFLCPAVPPTFTILQLPFIETVQKIYKNIRNSANRLYWLSVQEPCRDVLEAGGSSCKKSKLDGDTKI